jgi:uncharacterized protein
MGIGQYFTYGGAHGKEMESSCRSIDVRGVDVIRWMKTETGKMTAEERTERLRIYREWWKEEVGEVGV